MKYRLITCKDTITGQIKRACVINDTGEVVTEAAQPERYAQLRKKAIKNRQKSEFNQLLRDITGTSARAARLDMGL